MFGLTSVYTSFIDLLCVGRLLKCEMQSFYVFLTLCCSRRLIFQFDPNRVRPIRKFGWSLALKLRVSWEGEVLMTAVPKTHSDGEHSERSDFSVSPRPPARRNRNDRSGQRRCMICHDSSHRRAKLLPCGHCFCRHCLLELFLFIMLFWSSLEFPLYYQGTAVLIYQSKIWRHGIGSIKKLTFVLSLDWFCRKCSWQITILDILGVAIL